MAETGIDEVTRQVQIIESFNANGYSASEEIAEKSIEKP